MRKRTLFLVAFAAFNAQLMQSAAAEKVPLKFPFLPFGPVNNLSPVGNPAGFSFFPTSATTGVMSREARLSMPADNSPTARGILFLVTNRSVPASANPGFVQNIVTPNVASSGGAASCQGNFEGGNCPVASFVTDKLPNLGKFSRSGNMLSQFTVNASVQLGAGTTSGQACAIAHVVFFKDANRKNTSPENRLKYPLGVVCSTRDGIGNRSSVFTSFDVVGATLGWGTAALAIEVTCQYGGLTGTAAQQGAAAGQASCEAVQPILDISYLEITELVSTENPDPIVPGRQPGEHISG